MSNILVIGESCLDVFRYGECSRMCPDAPVPVFSPLSTFDNPGMAANVATNIKSLGHNHDLLTNPNGSEIQKIRYIDQKTNHMFLRVDKNDHKIDPLSPQALKDIGWDHYDAIIISDYNKGFLSTELIEEISRLHPLVFLDSKKPLGEWCGKIKYIKINYFEYAKTSNSITLSLMPKLIITLGPDGCDFQGQNFPVPAVEIKDSSGAGDTFIAALTLKYLEAEDIEKAISHANKCATTVVQKRGVSVV